MEQGASKTLGSWRLALCHLTLDPHRVIVFSLSVNSASLFSRTISFSAGERHALVARRHPTHITPETASAFLPGRLLIESKLHLRSKLLNSLFGVELGFDEET